MFNDAYVNKKVLITGHTGFKGTWLTLWLQKLGAHVSGFSNKIPTQPSMFEILNLGSRIDHHFGDICDIDAVGSVIDAVKPDFVFHLAAQPIVSLSYNDPVGTITANVVGTTNVLECLRQSNNDCSAVLITSDKCYENLEWHWGYRETDHLGGKDIYSGSKAAAEAVIHAYFHSFFDRKSSKVRIATGRAGNVIGGGDWAADRIVADCMRTWSHGNAVEIRSPNATRPWQHVLEPLSGYLTLGAALDRDATVAGESFNFGPPAGQVQTVQQLLSDLSTYWSFERADDAYRVINQAPFKEAGLLKLNCDKAIAKLQWQATLEYEECVRFVSSWYHRYYNHPKDMSEYSISQIKEYETLAENRKLVWANDY